MAFLYAADGRVSFGTAANAVEIISIVTTVPSGCKEVPDTSSGVPTATSFTTFIERLEVATMNGVKMHQSSTFSLATASQNACTAFVGWRS